MYNGQGDEEPQIMEDIAGYDEYRSMEAVNGQNDVFQEQPEILINKWKSRWFLKGERLRGLMVDGSSFIGDLMGDDDDFFYVKAITEIDGRIEGIAKNNIIKVWRSEL